MTSLDKTVKNIKSLKIQGAESIAEAGLEAWKEAEDKKKATESLLNARPTEPMLKNVLFLANQGVSISKIKRKLKRDKQEIFKIGSKLIDDGSVVFVHCHSSTVVGILKQAYEEGKRFEVHNTETRPFYQGRITSRELVEEGISVTHYTDSSAMVAMRKADLFLFGSDAITKKGSYNKIGTEMFAEVAAEYFNIPVYSCTHSWKVADEVKVETLSRKDIWPEAPKGVRIHNPAFELAESQFIQGIVSELGVLSVDNFLTKAKKSLGERKWD